MTSSETPSEVPHGAASGDILHAYHPQRLRLSAPSIVIEWENAGHCRGDRSARMLGALFQQLAELRTSFCGSAEVIVLCDAAKVDIAALQSLIEKTAVSAGCTTNTRIVESDRCPYYQQKNYGFSLTSRPTVIFLDSDVVPENLWLMRLLETLQEQRVAAVCGNTYIEPDSVYARSFAMFWFFPLRSKDEPSFDSEWFFANNVAFRREVFLAHPFPHADAFRGQCTLLARTLLATGHRILMEPKARVSHPPPNGIAHFVCRSLCEGRDECRLSHLYGEPGIRRALQRFKQDIRRSVAEILRRRTSLNVGLLGTVTAIMLAGLYYTLKLFGYLLSLVNHRIIDRWFPI
jgi:Glycosyl transferase family 2